MTGGGRDGIGRACLAATGLIAGYGVADATGVRWQGGVVLAVIGVLCGVLWWRALGPARAILLGCCYLVAFVVSHVLARAIGAWPAVLTVAVLTAAVALWAEANARESTAAPLS